MITVQRARELRAMIEKAAGAGLDNKDADRRRGACEVRHAHQLERRVEARDSRFVGHGGKHAGSRAELVGRRAV